MAIYNWRLAELSVESQLPTDSLPKSTIRGRKASLRARFRALTLCELERYHPSAVKAATAKALAALHIEGRKGDPQ